MKTIAYFISGHGYGHGVRSCVIINRIPSKNRILVFSSLPSDFFREELKVEYRHVPCELDSGCIQSDCVHIDIAATIKKYTEINKKREKIIKQFSGLIKKLGVELVLADIPPLAFPIAAVAGVPGIGISNFTWADIYQPYLHQNPEFSPVLEQINDDYGKADQYFSLYPNMEGKGFYRQEKAGIIARKGKNRRNELAATYGINPGKKWCLIYIGNFGLNGIQWERLREYSDWEFFGLYPLSGAPDNYHLLSKNTGFNYADFTASSHIVFGKLGYGLVAESLYHGIPTLFFERRNFAEYPYLKRALIKRGLGKEISLEKVRNLDFRYEIEALTQTIRKPLNCYGTDYIINALGL
jgi:L-arabinokinase